MTPQGSSSHCPTLEPPASHGNGGWLSGAVQVLLQRQDQRQTRVVSRAAAAQIGATKQMDGGASHEVGTSQSTGA